MASLTDNQVAVLTEASNKIITAAVVAKLVDVTKPSRMLQQMSKSELLWSVGDGDYSITDKGKAALAVALGTFEKEAPKPNSLLARIEQKAAELPQIEAKAEEKKAAAPKADGQLTEKQRALFDFVEARSKRGEGTSHGEMQKHLKWNSECLSVLKGAAQRLGRKLNSVKDGRSVIWFVEDEAA
jgi:DNA-binding PadR family transcriptional regulator